MAHSGVFTALLVCLVATSACASRLGGARNGYTRHPNSNRAQRHLNFAARPAADDVEMVDGPVGRHLLASTPPSKIESACAQTFGSKKASFILNADPGTYTGVAEDLYIMPFVTNKKQLPSDSTVCLKITTGQLFGQDVVLVTTGIGPVTAALCTQELLRCGAIIKELIFAGTSGYSSQLGGVLNVGPDGQCLGANIEDPQITRLGDVCVTPYAVNWDCKLTNFQEQCGDPGLNLCFDPKEDAGPDAGVALYGQCIFSDATAETLALNDELIRVSQVPVFANNLPIREQSVIDIETPYWIAMANGTGGVYNYEEIKYNPPKIWTYKECAEIDSQFFFSGVPYEITSRRYVAETITAAFDGTYNVTAEQVIIANAEEGIGFLQAIYEYSTLNSSYSIPYAMVRGSSDFTHMPVKEGATPDFWQPGPLINDPFGPGYNYAIASTSGVVLNLFQARCISTDGGKPNDYKKCLFNLGFPLPGTP